MSFIVSLVRSICANSAFDRGEHNAHVITKIQPIELGKKREVKSKIKEERSMKVQKLYEECVRRNEDLLMLVELMMNSYRYNKNNFYVNYNLEKFTNFEVKKINCEIEKPINEKKMKTIIEFFNNFYLIKNDTNIDSLVFDCRNEFITYKEQMKKEKR